jgi:hypothetical protein
MKNLIYTLVLCLAFAGCQDQNEHKVVSTPCQLVDIGNVGTQCDELRANGQHNQAAHLYFDAGMKNESSELFVYAAWQFGEGGHIDSALIAIKQAAVFGMNSPYILDKVGINESSKSSSLRPEVDQILADIKQKNASLENFDIVITPITRFWAYFNDAVKDTSAAKERLASFICEGSPAIKDYYHIRYENVDNMRRVMIQQNPRYYQYLRNHMTEELLDKVSLESKAMMKRFSELYPKAIFPKTYIVPDLINGTGTLTELGLFIGADMFAKSDSMPTENLNDWQIGAISDYDEMKFHLVHELMHFQQSYGNAEYREALLGKLIEEGVCDFLVSLLTEDNQISAGVQYNLDYLSDPKNYAFAMEELKRDIYGNDLSLWMHNGGGIKDRPANLGYTMGFLICQSYYSNSPDKKQAIAELLTTKDFKGIIQGSKFKDIL